MFHNTEIPLDLGVLCVMYFDGDKLVLPLFVYESMSEGYKCIYVLLVCVCNMGGI